MEHKESAEERVARMDRLLRDVSRIFEADRQAVLTDVRLQESVRALFDYYTGGAWLEDYERDERGGLPEGLGRGVLAQDALDSLLSRIRDFAKETEKQEENAMVIRFAQREDVPVILGFIRALAEYEKLADEVVATQELLSSWLFDKRTAEVLLLEEGGVPAGFALFFHNFSTFLGRGGIYLEDLFVSPQYRGRGYGKALLTRLAQIAVERGCGRLEWSCLDWNRPSIDFYLSMGAKPMEGWTVYRLTGDTLAQAAGAAGRKTGENSRE